VLFDEVRQEELADAHPLSSAGWKVDASDGSASAGLAIDGLLDTRWGSASPQRRGMTFTITLPEPTDVAWLHLRTGRFVTDRARALAVETSRDGTHWRRREVPGVLAGVQWRDGVPQETASGDLDLWIGEEKLSAVRLVNLGESSHFDWSIAELTLDGRENGRAR
jgi:hypothetical protein